MAQMGDKRVLVERLKDKLAVERATNRLLTALMQEQKLEIKHLREAIIGETMAKKHKKKQM